MTIAFDDLPRTDEFFVWEDANTGALTHIAVSALLRWLPGRVPPQGMALTPDLVAAVRRQNGVETDHLSRIDAARLEVPVLVLEWGDGTSIVADGSHRILKRAAMGMVDAQAYIVPRALWVHFVIPDVPGAATEWANYLEQNNPDAPRPKR